MRKLINEEQTQEVRTYADQNGVAVVVHQGGIIFSDDAAMDDTIKYFKDVLGFKEVKTEKVAKSTKK